ncbi:hypothetical protein F3D3_0517 [Fusibacter sp. 3D3]|nr:hypothetical protein F3D3_0517 [Fusibacter sp. 3D3]
MSRITHDYKRGGFMIAIGICEKVNGICTTTGCFKAFPRYKRRKR